MALYRLISVKFSRREHKRDPETGKLMFKDDDKKIPIYDLKQYKIGDRVELNAAEARRLKNDIQPIGGAVQNQNPTPIQFVPDGGDTDTDQDTDIDQDTDTDPKIAAVLSGNVDQVVAYINDHADDEDTLEALRKAEKEGKDRKAVINALNDLLGE